MHPILFITTGGTFDKRYHELDGTLSFNKSHLTDMLTLSRTTLNTRTLELMQIDSLDMTIRHREQLLFACRYATENHIIITHGTDTMEITADFLKGKIPGKTIVLTGAMIPYAFGSSDGLFNLGAATAFVQTLSPGVYIAMNGKYFTAGQVKKNKSKGIFEPS